MNEPPGTAARRFCGQCGDPLGDATRFCGSCGAPVRAPEAAAVPFLAATARRGGRRGLLWLAVLAVLAAGGIVAAIVAGGGAQAVSLTDEATGQILALDSDNPGSLSFEKPQARYRLSNVRVDHRITATLTPNTFGFNPSLALTSDDGRELRRSFGGGQLTYGFTEPGTYHLEVSALGSSSGGFSLRVSVASAEPRDGTGGFGGGEGRSVTPAVREGIVGVWTKTAGGESASEEITFRSDGTYEQRFGADTPVRGTYTYDAAQQRLVLAFEGRAPDCQGLVADAIVSADQLTVTTKQICDTTLDTSPPRIFRRA